MPLMDAYSTLANAEFREVIELQQANMEKGPLDAGRRTKLLTNPPESELEMKDESVCATTSTTTTCTTTCTTTGGMLSVNSKQWDEKMDEAESRPPSPPSGRATPKLHIMPCPTRLQPLIPPPNYGAVTPHIIYRSSFPQDRNIEFCTALGIKSILNLVQTDPNPAYTTWVREQNLQLTHIAIAPNKDGQIRTTPDSICAALLHLLDASLAPWYVHCNQGRHRTGCVIACLRRVQHVEIDTVIAEYRAYAHPKARPGDEAFIRAFRPESVFEYAKTQGFLDGEAGSGGGRGGNEPRGPGLKRLDSTITDTDTLAEALAAGAMVGLEEGGGGGGGTGGVSSASSWCGGLEIGGRAGQGFGGGSEGDDAGGHGDGVLTVSIEEVAEELEGVEVGKVPEMAPA